jgi:hypothetical protein
MTKKKEEETIPESVFLLLRIRKQIKMTNNNHTSENSKTIYNTFLTNNVNGFIIHVVMTHLSTEFIE